MTTKKISPSVELQNRMELIIDDHGIKVKCTQRYGTKKSEYVPAGLQYTFPIGWNIKEAAGIFIDYLIADQNEIIRKANIFKIQLETLRSEF